MVSKNQQIIAYPNPTRGLFTLELRGSQECAMTRMEIFSMNGLKVFTQELNGGQKHTFSVEGLNPGIYFIHVTISDGPETFKLVKL
jgi:hypothetical protein